MTRGTTTISGLRVVVMSSSLLAQGRQAHGIRVHVSSVENASAVTHRKE